MLDFEKLYAKNQLSGMVYEINPKRKTRFSRSPLSSSLEITQSQSYQRRKCAKLGTIFAWLYVPSSPEKIGKIVDAGFEKHYAMTKSEFNWNIESSEPKIQYKCNYSYMVELMTGLTYPVYFRIHEIYLKYLTLRRGSRLLVAIKQYKNEHGRWPENLEAIKSAAPAEAFLDPVTGELLQYENHGERFSLYGEKTNVWPG